MNNFYDEFYLHAIGPVNNSNTYEILSSILRNKAIYSRQQQELRGKVYKGFFETGWDLNESL